MLLLTVKMAKKMIDYDDDGQDYVYDDDDNDDGNEKSHNECLRKCSDAGQRACSERPCVIVIVFMWSPSADETCDTPT